MNDQEATAGELETDDLQWDTASIRPKEQDQTFPLWVGRAGRPRAMLHDVARPILPDPVPNGRSAEADGRITWPLCPT